jgi:hypothetical protein
VKRRPTGPHVRWTNARIAADFLGAIECAHDEIEGCLTTKAMRPMKRRLLKTLRGFMNDLRPLTNDKPTWTKAPPMPHPKPAPARTITATWSTGSEATS